MLDVTTYVEYAPKLVNEFLAKIKNSAIFKIGKIMFYSEILYENIANTVVQRAKKLMLDSLGTAIAASKEECVLNAFKAF